VRALIITADDLGYDHRYDRGILLAAEEGLIDAASVMVGRPVLDPAAARATGVELGLHLELGGSSDSPRATAAERSSAARALEQQLERFTRLFGAPPAYLDGHHHCHARPGLGIVVAEAASAAGCPVRSIDPRHRRLLRCRGVPTQDALIGRLSERQPARPPELDAGLSAGITEWAVHPGLAGGPSSYDDGREEDLRTLRALQLPEGVVRTDHAALRDPGAGSG
jgi:hypothetical protein